MKTPGCSKSLTSLLLPAVLLFAPAISGATGFSLSPSSETGLVAGDSVVFTVATTGTITPPAGTYVDFVTFEVGVTGPNATTDYFSGACTALVAGNCSVSASSPYQVAYNSPGGLASLSGNLLQFTVDFTDV